MGSVGWGYPTDRIAALWSLCPELAVPANSALTCDQSTCAMVCDQGYIATGKRRTRCRWKKAQGFFWKKQLGGCETCTDLTVPASITGSSGFNGRNKKTLALTCANGGQFSVGAISPLSIKLKCKCPRSAPGGARTCGWYSAKMSGAVDQSALDSLVCSDPVTTVAPGNGTDVHMGGA